MSLLEILALSVGLAMDCTAVAATRGLIAPRLHWRGVATMALLFGGFQAGMPLIGWALGAAVGPLVERWDHWIAFALLAVIGGKMIKEAFGPPEADDTRPADAFQLRLLLVLAVATSIDALAVGVTLPMLNAPMALTLSSIGVVAATGAVAGVFLGRRFGALVGRRLDVLGGLVLIGLGTRILLSHLTGA